MDKKPNKGIIAAAAVLGVIICILVGVLIGLAVINGGGTDELVTDAFCEMVKDEGEKNYYRIPKLNIKKDWAEEVNEKIYDTLYDEYEKGKVLYDGNSPTVSEMGYEWAEKDGIVSITVQLKNAFTGRYEFFVFNIDTNKEREITDEELIEVFGYDKTEYFGMMKDVLRDIYNSEVQKTGNSGSSYENMLEEATKDESLENSLSFITDEGKLNVILPVFSADAKENVDAIVDIETGEKQDYFEFAGEYEEIKVENELNAEETTAGNASDSDRLEIRDEDINALAEYVCNAAIGESFDSTTATATDVVNEHIFNSVCGAMPGTYNWFFDDIIMYGDLEYTEPWAASTREFVPDPRGEFPNGDPDWFDYIVVPEENIKWICENIYHVSFDSFSDSSVSYVQNGNVYIICGMGGDVPPYSQLYSKTRLNDGRYNVIMYVPEYYECYVSFILDVRMIDDKRCVTFYEINTTPATEFDPSSVSGQNNGNGPTNADYQALFEMAYHGMADFNSNTADTAYVINRYITSIFGVGDYAIYFDDAQVCSTYSGENDKDPQGRFEYYSKLPAENVKWMCENVYNIEFDENYVSDNSYCEGGYVYTYAIAAGDGPMASQVKSEEKLSDGRYCIVLESGWNYENPDVIDVESEICIIAEIKETDGIRHWSFYDVKTKNLR